MDPTEDIPYNVSDFATPEAEKKLDEDRPNRSVLVQVQKYLSDAIDKHNTLDVIEPNAEGIMSTQQQILVHKEVVGHLRTIKTMVDNKLKELK